MEGTARLSDPSQERAALDEYVHEVTTLCDQNVEEIIPQLSVAAAGDLRASHYRWKLDRDVSCAAAGRESPDPLAEPLCLADRLSERYDELELLLYKLEPLSVKPREQVIEHVGIQ